MKKRLFTMLILAILLLVGMAFSAQAAEIPTDVEWIEIGSAADFDEWFAGAGKCKLLTDGYEAGMTRYLKLTEDVTVTNPGTYYLNSGTYLVNVYWDLNGHTLTYAEPSVTGAPRFFGSYNAGSTVTFVNGTITNLAVIDTSHGALFTINKGNLVMEDVTIYDQEAYAFTKYGKVFSINTDQNCTLTNVDIYVNNTSTTGAALGGAIRCLGTLNMTDCSLTSIAKGTVKHGGLLFQSGGVANLTRCSFTGGVAVNGGGLYAENATVTATDCTFTGGKTTNSGSNVYLINTAAQFEDCEFIQNNPAANKFGGNFYCQTNTVELTGCTITGGKSGNGGAVYSVNGNLILDSTAVSGGHATTEGGNIMHKNGAITLQNGTTITGGVSNNLGGNLSLSNTAKFYMSDSVIISGGSAVDGGNVHASLVEAAASAPVLNISGGIITGGKATGNGGNLNLVGMDGKLVTLKLTGGTIGGTPADGQEYSGTAANGGNISGNYSTMDISAGTVSNGYASTGGANLIATRSTVNISGTALFEGGYSKDLGGNLYASTACTMNITGGTVTGGTAKDRGGNLYMSSTNTKVNISGGLMKDGFAYMSGGNIYHGNGKLTITGGVISGGKAESTGGNIQANMGYGASASASGKLTIQDDGDASTPLPQIINGQSICADGGNLYMAAAGNVNETGANTLVLGDCIISGGKASGVGQDLYIAAIADLQILPEYAQDITVYIEDAMLPAQVGGSLNTDRATATGVFTGKLVLENHNGPYIFAVEGDTALYLTGAAVVKDGSYAWYKTNEEAVAAYTENACLQATAGEMTLLGGSYLVDIAGQTVAINGSGTVTLFDSSNDTFDTFGTATVADVTVANTPLTRVDGKDYYMVAADGVYSLHRVQACLTNVAIRPSSGGIYFTAKWSCDETVKPLIENFGVVVSMKNYAGADFANDETALWTTFTAADFESGVNKTGVMIEGILKDAGATQERIAMNGIYAQMNIFAEAYVTIDGVSYTGLGASYSMYDILKTVADRINDYYAQAEVMQSFMAQWGAKGLAGEPWDALNFAVSEDVLKLNGLYAGLQPYYGELHDHADTGGTSDGNQPLSLWKTELEKLQMDFAAIVDHRQSLHMYLEDWDNSIFIGGSEAAGTIRDRTGVFLHYNMIFSDPAGLEAVVAAFPEYNWRVWSESDREGTGGQWHFDYPRFTAERFSEVCEAVYANGGFVALVHPKADGYIDSTDPADAYFYEGTAIEVFYTYHSTRDGYVTKRNYDLWTGMLKAGYKVYATAGNDEHNMPSDKAVSVIYSAERSADAWVQQLRKGQFVAGGVGVRSCMGDTMMGGTTSFEGKRFSFSVGDFHVSLLDPSHTYRADVHDQNGVVFSGEVSATETTYFAFDADNASDYYYIEIYDVTDDSLIAIGNPIWNEK